LVNSAVKNAFNNFFANSTLITLAPKTQNIDHVAFHSAQSRDAFAGEPVKIRLAIQRRRLGGFANLPGGHQSANRQSRRRQTLFELQPKRG